MPDRRTPERRKVDRKDIYQGPDRRDGMERRTKHDMNYYASLTSDGMVAIGVFKVNPRVYKENNGFEEPAYVYDRRDKNYQAWHEQYLKGLIRMNPELEEQTREVHHKWGDSDLLESVHRGAKENA